MHQPASIYSMSVTRFMTVKQHLSFFSIVLQVFTSCIFYQHKEVNILYRDTGIAVGQGYIIRKKKRHNVDMSKSEKCTTLSV